MLVALALLHAVIAFALLAAVLETFSAEPRWPRPPAPGSPQRLGRRGLSPRERRWVDGGLALVVAANGVNMLQLGAEAAVSTIALSLGIAGAAAMVVGLLRGPSDRDWALLEARRSQRESGVS